MAVPRCNGTPYRLMTPPMEIAGEAGVIALSEGEFFPAMNSASANGPATSGLLVERIGLRLLFGNIRMNMFSL